MKKNTMRLLSLVSIGAMILPLAACGSKEAAAPAATATSAAETPTATSATSAPAETTSDDVLRIQCWNEEFKSRLIDHYPGYEEIDATHGKIGDVAVEWVITPSTDNAYQNNLDQVLLDNASKPDSEKTDMFLVEADYALKYVNSDYTMPIADLGITDDEIADQYKYTHDIVTDSNGVLKGLSWQGCPGVLIYNREAAKAALGTDDPAEVQKSVADWDTYTATAEKVKAAGYNMTAGAFDTFRVYSNNVTTPWVVDGKINIDDNIKKWVDDSKKLVDAGETTTADLWSDDWNKGFYPDGKVFCYFGPAWLINFCMAADQEGSIANQGGWGAVVGPQSFNWGGTWICATTDTDDKDLVADIMRKLTCDPEIMTDIVKKDNDFINNEPAMEAASTDDAYKFDVLGGQNPLPLFCEGVKTIDMANVGPYDQGCVEEFQKAMKNYFEGNATYDEALEQFDKAVVEKYPELTY